MIGNGGASFHAGGAGGTPVVTNYWPAQGGFGGGYSGGGGSYLDAFAIAPLLTTTASPGNGSVTITLESASPVPEPTSVALVLGSLILLGTARGAVSRT